MALTTTSSIEVPVRIVGSSTFGLYPIISAERTFNMFISDGWLVSFAGYSPAMIISSIVMEGRALFHSVRGNFIIAVKGASVYRINSISELPIFLFNLGSNEGEVLIDENLSSQIAIVATPECWIYNYSTNTFGQPALNANLVPNYVTYHNTYFLFGNANTTSVGDQWFVYGPGTGFDLTFITFLPLETKPDFAIAVTRIPGKGNNVIVFGTTVAELWTNVPGLQIYQRNSSVNIDYGLANVNTIATSDEMVVWLGINENSAVSIMVMRGSGAQAISTDGIDSLLQTIKFPADSTANFHRQDGHVFYILTFFNPADNISIMYDFTTEKFFDVCDWNRNYFPARQVTYFNNETYFIGLNDGVIYNFSTTIGEYIQSDGKPREIPRVRITDTFRYNRPERFINQLFTFTVENGVQIDSNIPNSPQPRIDYSFSINGGETFSKVVPYYMNTTGNYKNQPRFSGLGAANQFTSQSRFWNMSRVACWDGIYEIRT